jgi:hypothetical protein
MPNTTGGAPPGRAERTGPLGAAMRSPSGYTAAGTVVYAGLLALLAGGAWNPGRAWSCRWR